MEHYLHYRCFLGASSSQKYAPSWVPIWGTDGLVSSAIFSPKGWIGLVGIKVDRDLIDDFLGTLLDSLWLYFHEYKD